MQSSQDYSLIHVVSHLKYCLKHNNPQYSLTLEYKFAKPNQPTQGNKKFERFLQDSHQSIVVLNANRETKRMDYVHLKSAADLKDFNAFGSNLLTLKNIHKTQSQMSQKVDLTSLGQRISFDSDTCKWTYKSRRLLFKPNYETIKNGKLFRISLLSQAKGDKGPRKKVIELLQAAVDTVLENQKKIQTQKHIQQTSTKEEQTKQEKSKQKQHLQHPLRFKTEERIILNDCLTIVLSQVYQSISVKLYKSISDLISTHKNSENDIFGKVFLSSMVQEIFQDLKDDLHYEVQMKFNPDFLKEIENEDNEDVYHKMELAAEVFTALAKDPKQFSAEEVVHTLKIISQT